MAKDRRDLASVFLRVPLSLVFLYFGFNQISDPLSWTGFVPEFVTKSFLSAANIVMLNGIFELTLGTFMIIGLYTRFSSLVLSLHLLAIAAPMGLSPVGVRDFGLAFATFAVYLLSPGPYSIDRYAEKKKSNKKNISQ